MEKITFIIPCYNSESTLHNVVKNLIETVLRNNINSYEIILINDGSQDLTSDIIEELCHSNSCITGISFCKNFGQHSALMAGFRQGSGDIYVCLDDDGQTPPEESFRLIDKLYQGYDVVYAKYEEKKHSFFRNWGSKINSKMTEFLLNKTPDLYISSYFACKKYIRDSIITYHYPYPYVIGLVLRATKNITNVTVNHKVRTSGTSGYTIKKLINLWLNGFTAFSIKPLRIATFFGLLFSLFGFFYATFAIVNKIVNPNVLVGWSSMIAALMIIGGIILFMLGLIGEYIGRIYICINNSPQYVIKETINNISTNKEQIIHEPKS